MGSKLHVAINERFYFDGGSGDVHGRSKCWGNFYNFRLASVLANYCGVDLGSYLGHKKDRQGKPLRMR